MLYRFAASSACARPAGRPGRDRQGRFLPVTSQSTVTLHRSAMRARSRDENRRVPLRDFDSLESSSPISARRHGGSGLSFDQAQHAVGYALHRLRLQKICENRKTVP